MAITVVNRNERDEFDVMSGNMVYAHTYDGELGHSESVSPVLSMLPTHLYAQAKYLSCPTTSVRS